MSSNLGAFTQNGIIPYNVSTRPNNEENKEYDNIVCAQNFYHTVDEGEERSDPSRDKNRSKHRPKGGVKQ